MPDGGAVSPAADDAVLALAVSGLALVGLRPVRTTSAPQALRVAAYRGSARMFRRVL